ncbi:MAG: HAD family hydrolase [Planctomycetaceae bacterium]
MSQSNPIRCIAFDAVGTLIEPSPSVASVYHEAGRRYGSRLSPEEVAARFHEVFRRSAETAGDAELTTSEEQERRRWREIVAAVFDDVCDHEACFAELFAHFARPSAWRCYPDVPAALDALNAQERLLAVASNFDARLSGVCDALPELRPIRLRVISSLVGVRKPSIEFYRRLAMMAALPPHEIVMVGDDLENDILPARAAGLHAVRIVRHRPPIGHDEIGDLRELSAWIINKAV